MCTPYCSGLQHISCNQQYRHSAYYYLWLSSTCTSCETQLQPKLCTHASILWKGCAPRQAAVMPRTIAIGKVLHAMQLQYCWLPDQAWHSVARLSFYRAQRVTHVDTPYVETLPYTHSYTILSA